MYSKEKQYKIAMILLCPVQGPWASSISYLYSLWQIPPHGTITFDLVTLTLPFDLHLKARRGGIEVAGWTVARTVRVRFPDCVWAL